MDKSDKQQNDDHEIALREALADYAEGRTVSESIDEHIKRLTSESEER